MPPVRLPTGRMRPNRHLRTVRTPNAALRAAQDAARAGFNSGKAGDDGRQGPASAVSGRFHPRETYRRDKPDNGAGHVAGRRVAVAGWPASTRAGRTVRIFTASAIAARAVHSRVGAAFAGAIGARAVHFRARAGFRAGAGAAPSAPSETAPSAEQPRRAIVDSAHAVRPRKAIPHIMSQSLH